MKFRIYLRFVINFHGNLIFIKGEYQLRHLVRAFKDFMGVVNNQRRTKETKILSKPIFYPLNQFHKDFVEKAKKGISDINWYGLLEQIQNEVDEDSLELLEEGEKNDF